MDPYNKLERWEVAIIKAMMAATPCKADQDILASFTQTTRSIIHGRIKDIRDGKTHTADPARSAQELEDSAASLMKLGYVVAP